MSRVEIASMPWGTVQDGSGNAQSGVTVNLKNLDGTAATTWSAVTGGASSTASLTTDVNGTLPRFVDGGQYLVDVPLLSITGRRVEAVSGSVERGRGLDPHDPVYGATGDGTTNDSSALQAVLTAATGGRKRVTGRPDAVYNIDGVEIPNGVTFDLNGARLRHKSGSTTFCIRTAPGSTGAQIINGEVDGNQPNQTIVLNTVELFGIRPLLLGVDIWDSPYHPVAVRENTFHATIDTVNIFKVNAAYSAQNHGINVLGNSVDATNMPEHTLITGCHITDTLLSNIGIGAGKWTTIANNKLERSGAAGDGVASYVSWNSHTLIIGNTFRDHDNHFVHAGGDNVTIIGNHGFNAGAEGYVVQSSPNSDPTPALNCHVSGNTAVTTRTLGGAQGALYRIERYTNVTIGPELSVGASLSAMNIVDCVDVSIYPGTIKDCLSHGIRLAGCVRVAINGGVIRNNASNGIVCANQTRVDTTVVETTDVEINGTLITGNTGWGVLLSNSTARVAVNATVKGNTAGNLSMLPNRTTHWVAPGKTDTSVSLASATTLTLVPDHAFFDITGTTPITSITTSWPGRVIYLRFVTGAASMLVDGSNLKLGGSLSPDADDVVSLISNGTNWYQAAPMSVN